jgi:toxin-antitoxin system PIN domain toxin
VKPALLDVNVLIALFDPDHIHHDIAHDWFAHARHGGWATCPVTELALVRTISNPDYWPGAERTGEIVERLRQFRASGDHQFWRDTLELTDEIFKLAWLHVHSQLTDVYLLGLAVKRNGRLATFDRTIPLAAVAGATEETVVVVGSG